MIDEIVEYRELLVDKIASGEYCFNNKKNTKVFPVKIKSSDKRVNPPKSSFYIIRHFLFDKVDSWSNLTFEEKQIQIEKAKIAYLCWLGDKDSYEQGKILLKEEFNTLVKDDISAYELFCNENPNAIKLKENREKVIEKLKKNDGFYCKKPFDKYNYSAFNFDTIIQNSIAAGPLKSYVIAFKKDEIKSLYDKITSYNCVYEQDFSSSYAFLTLTFTVYLKIQQIRYFDSNPFKYIEVSNTEILSLLNQNEKLLNDNGAKDPKFNFKLAATRKYKKDEFNIEDLDTAFKFKILDSNNLWLPNYEISSKIHLFESINDIENPDDYLIFYGLTGPDFKTKFNEEISKFISK